MQTTRGPLTRVLPLSGVALLILFVPGARHLAIGKPLVAPDSQHQLITLSDSQGDLTLRLNYRTGCVLDRVMVQARQVVSSSGVCTGMRIGEEWFTSKTANEAKVEVEPNGLTVRGIRFGKGDAIIRETWKFSTLTDRIVWRITREYPKEAKLEEMAFPEWNFKDMSTWVGGMLDNGGTVLTKYLDKPNATYGAHFGTVTFWNSESNEGLRIMPGFKSHLFGAGRFSRQSDGALSFLYSIIDDPPLTKHGLYRFLNDKQDVWQPIQVRPGEITAEFVIQALKYDQAYDRGTLKGVEEKDVRELLNTVARYGVIDSRLAGGNGWRSGYICLHEPFFAQIAATLDAADYTANLSAALDFARDHAINADGRVKSRWAYGPYDAMPGTYDPFGFYEAQWGYLLDSQPDYVMNVVEQYYLTGDRPWLARHKQTCERALEFLMRREVGQSGLVGMLTDSHTSQRGSDWIDIIWASYENALINAELYAALGLWAEAEEALNEPAEALHYRRFAARLKEHFNLPTSEGGLWDPVNQWYVHWRDRDGSVHGNNLVTPVNFAAIAYGLCDDPVRQKSILDQVEAEMEKEGLFYWPLCFFSYQPGEGADRNFPFPDYENGDIFLSWGELGVRAYAAYRPELALKYVRNALARYAKDGLSFQRYLRKSQVGEGDDILAGNCMPIVGLYRDLYGIQPRPNRLYLEPHLTQELNGTILRYWLRGTDYRVRLSTEGNEVTAANCTLCDTHPFGVNATASGLQYFHGTNSNWNLEIRPAKDVDVTIQIHKWSADTNGPWEWTMSSKVRQGKTSYVLNGLKPGEKYQLSVDGTMVRIIRAGDAGKITFEQHALLQPVRLRIAPVEPR